MIYVVEDDKSIRELVAYALGSAGYETESFTSSGEFFAALDAGRARLVLLDIMLPGEDGLAILRRLRESPETAGIPVMIMSALGTELDKVRGLDLGADDYIAKPFGIMEFLARVRALLRRGEPREQLAVRGVVLYPAGRRVEAAGTEVQLTAKEFDLLEYLMRRAGQRLARAENAYNLHLRLRGDDDDGPRSKRGPSSFGGEDLHGGPAPDRAHRRHH